MNKVPHSVRGLCHARAETRTEYRIFSTQAQALHGTHRIKVLRVLLQRVQNLWNRGILYQHHERLCLVAVQTQA